MQQLSVGIIHQIKLFILTVLVTLSGRHERNFLAIATEDGVYVSLRDNLDRPVQVLQLPNVTHMIALESYDCFVLIVEKTLYSYSLEPLASVALGQVPSKPVEQTMQILAPRHKGHVAFFRVGSFGDRDYRTSICCSFTPERMRYSRAETFLVVYGTPGPVYTAIHTLLITHEAFQPRKGDVRIHFSCKISCLLQSCRLNPSWTSHMTRTSCPRVMR